MSVHRCPNCKAVLPVRYVSAKNAVRANASKDLTASEIASRALVSVPTARSVLATEKLPFKPTRSHRTLNSVAARAATKAARSKTIEQLAIEIGAPWASVYRAVLYHNLPYKRVRKSNAPTT